jgi:hypothetical protein
VKYYTWNEVCTKEDDLYGHVRRDADQMKSCEHGKLILILSNLDSKPRVIHDTVYAVKSDSLILRAI